MDFDEIHKIYIRFTEIGEALLSHPDFSKVASSPSAGELLGRCSQIGQEAARLKVFTHELSLKEPELFRVWQDALAKPSV